MKKIISVLLGLFLITAVSFAQAPKLPTTKGTVYGEKITAVGAVSPDDITTILKDKKNANITIKGKVAEVCQAKGCFLYLESKSGKIYVKTKDDKFFVPVELEGKTIVVKGEVSIDKDSKEVSVQAIGVLVV